ncbi:MAG: replication-relaxation family protein [Acidimicrobiia bacterium]|nr:replication-relaxation family protein [Acidimicrobiia bacterium]
MLLIVRMASGAQLNRLIWPTTASGARTTRRRLKRLTDLRIIARLYRQVGGIKGGSQGYTYALDVAGQRVAQRRHTRTIRRPEPSNAFVDHTLGVTEIYVTLREAEAAGEIELESFAAEPECWRRFTGRGGRSTTLKPDAYAAWLTPEWELLAFFEVDRGTEHPERLKRKIQAYLSYWNTGDEQRQSNGVFPSVIWIAQDTRRAGVIQRLVDDIPEAGEICVSVTADQLASYITNAPREEVNT